MISTLVTIIITSKDSLIDLKATLENLSKQTRITGTNVRILDLGSKDGSFQYSAQASLDLRKKLRIESVEVKGDGKNLYNGIETPYVLWIRPGTILDSNDFIFNYVNKIAKGKKIYIRPKNSKNLIKRIFPGHYLKNYDLTLSFILCRKDLLNKINYNKSPNFLDITIDEFTLSNDYKIIRGEISEYNGK